VLKKAVTSRSLVNRTATQVIERTVISAIIVFVQESGETTRNYNRL